MTLTKRRPAVIHLGAFLAYALLTVLMTFPLVLRLADSVPGWPGDNLLYVWLLWWYKRALVDLSISPTFSPLLFAPHGLEMARTEMTWANTVLALPLTTLWGSVIAYNVMQLLSFVLTGFATYLWIWQITKDHIAGFVAGTIFAFSPYRMAHSPGHLPLMATQWLPFLLFAVERLACTRRLRFAALGGLFLGLNAWASWYYFYISLFMIPIYLLIRFGHWLTRLRSPRFWQACAVLLAVGFAMLAPAALPFLNLHQTGQMQHPFFTLERLGANPTDFFVPNLLHPIWGEALRELVPFQWTLWVEKSLYLGVIPLLLALLAVLWKRRQRSVRALAWLAVLSFVLALGPTLHWAGQRVHLTIPTGAMALLYHLGITPYLTARIDPVLLGDMQLNHYIFVPLPSLLLYLFVPFTNAMRAIGRFGMVTTLAVAALAGWGMAALREKSPGRFTSWFLPTVVLGLVLFEFFALPYEMTTLRPRPIDLWLAEQPEGVMVELPITNGLRPLKEYYATIHQQGRLFGPTNLPFNRSDLVERGEHLYSFPDADSMASLRAYGVTYVIVHTDEYDNWAERVAPWETDGQLRLGRCFEDICGYIIAPADQGQ